MYAKKFRLPIKQVGPASRPNGRGSPPAASSLRRSGSSGQASPEAMPAAREAGQRRPASQTVFRSAYFLLKASSNDVLHNRFGIIISTSSVKESTMRHFWKRHIADHLRSLPNLQKDFLVIVSPKIRDASPEDVKKELGIILEKVKC